MGFTLNRPHIISYHIEERDPLVVNYESTQKLENYNMARATTSDSGTDDKYKKAASLNVEKLNLQPSDPNAAKIFKLWKLKFEIHTRALECTRAKATQTTDSS